MVVLLFGGEVVGDVFVGACALPVRLTFFLKG